MYLRWKKGITHSHTLTQPTGVVPYLELNPTNKTVTLPRVMFMEYQERYEWMVSLLYRTACHASCMKGGCLNVLQVKKEKEN